MSGVVSRTVMHELWVGRAKALGFVFGVSLGGCAAVQQFGTGAEEPGSSCTERTWDLGTGSAADIRTLAPGFYRLRPDGWHAPSQPLAMEDEQRRRAAIEQANSPRMRALVAAVGDGSSGISLLRTRIDDINVYEFGVATDVSTQAVVQVTSMDFEQFVFLAVAGKCPNVVVQDSCSRGALTLDVSAGNMVNCMSGRLVGEVARLEIQWNAPGAHAWENAQQRSFDLKFGEPVRIPDSEIGLNIRDSRPSSVRVGHEIGFRGKLTANDVVLWEGSLMLDHFKGTSVRSIQAMLNAGGMEHSVVAAMKAMPSLDENEKKLLAEARIQGAAAQAREIRAPKDAVYVYTRHAFGKGLPQDEQVLATLVPKLKSVFSVDLSEEPSEEDLGFLMSLLMKLERAGVDVGTERKALGERYGPRIADRTITKAALVERFAQLYAGSAYVTSMREQLATEERERLAEVHREQEEREAQLKREEAADRSKCLSRCDHKCMSAVYVDKALCRAGCANYDCNQNECVGACQVDCSMAYKAGQPGCVSACKKGRCGL